MAVDNLHEKLSKVISKEPSKWLADATHRQANKKSLKRSQKVALMVLSRLDELKMTQTMLADKLGITKQQVNKWVKGNENFTFETISKLEDVLDFQILEICESKPKEVIILETTICITVQPSSLEKKQSNYPISKEGMLDIEQTNNFLSFSRSPNVNQC